MKKILSIAVIIVLLGLLTSVPVQSSKNVKAKVTLTNGKVYEMNSLYTQKKGARPSQLLPCYVDGPVPMKIHLSKFSTIISMEGHDMNVYKDRLSKEFRGFNFRKYVVTRTCFRDDSREREYLVLFRKNLFIGGTVKKKDGTQERMVFPVYNIAFIMFL
ncbi:MAG: hypothetical protein K8T10_13450 [Candidatus Eremiobacteraeota bacterium]|nr:hypothetical protein [Candidatus Eremiobacteraeota bacterium]